MTKATEYLFRKSPALMFVLSVHLQKKAQWFPPFFLNSVLLKTSRKTSLKSPDRSPEGALIYLYVVQYEIPRLAQWFWCNQKFKRGSLFQINLAKCFWSARNYCPQKSVKLGLPSSFLISFLNLKIQRSFNWLNLCYDKM